MKLSIVLIVVALAGVLFMVLRPRADLSGTEARRLVEGGARLIDVRSPEEFAAGHLPGAINMPVEGLIDDLQNVGPKDQPIVLYCASGARSALAAGTLKRSGYLKVHNLGAKSRW